MSAVAELRMIRGRWWDYVGDHVTGATKLSDYTYEVETPFGVGCVKLYLGETGAELVGFLPKGTKKALYWDCFNCGEWLQKIGKLRNKKRACGAELYARAAGKGWGNS